MDLKINRDKIIIILVVIIIILLIFIFSMLLSSKSGLESAGGDVIVQLG